MCRRASDTRGASYPQRASSIPHPVYCSCNVDASGSPDLAPKVSPYVILTLPLSGKKVAIIGLTPADTATTSSPGGCQACEGSFNRM